MSLRDLLYVKAGGSGGGSGSDRLVITVDVNTGSADKTWNEIYDALAGGKFVVGSYSFNREETAQYIGLAAICEGASSYAVYLLYHNGGTSVAAGKLVATSADGYPAFTN